MYVSTQVSTKSETGDPVNVSQYYPLKFWLVVGCLALMVSGCNPLDVTRSVSNAVRRGSDWADLAEKALGFDELKSAAMLVERGMQEKPSDDIKAELLQLKEKIEARQQFYNSQVEDLLNAANKAVANREIELARELVGKALMIRQATNLELAQQTNEVIDAMGGGSIGEQSASVDNGESDQDWADIAEEMRPGVLKVLVCNASQPIGEGTGFAVGSNLIVTNSHVVRDESGSLAEYLFVIDAEKKLVPIHGILHEEQRKDIAILLCKTSWPKESRLELSAANPLYQKNNRQGDMVAAFGHPVGLSFSFSTGHLSAVRTAPEMRVVRTGDESPREGIWVQHTAPISPGNSGGPLLNRRGEVLAMNTLGSNGKLQNLNFSISAKDITDAIGTANTMDATAFRDPPQKLIRMLENNFLSR